MIIICLIFIYPLQRVFRFLLLKSFALLAYSLNCLVLSPPKPSALSWNFLISWRSSPVEFYLWNKCEMITAAELGRAKKKRRRKYKNKFSMWPEYELSFLYADALKSFFCEKKLEINKKKSFSSFFSFALVKNFRSRIFFSFAAKIRILPYRFCIRCNNFYNKLWRNLSSCESHLNLFYPAKVVEILLEQKLHKFLVCDGSRKNPFHSSSLRSSYIARLIAHAICIIQSKSFHPISSSSRRDSRAWKKFVMDLPSHEQQQRENFHRASIWRNNLRTKDQCPSAKW